MTFDDTRRRAADIFAVCSTHVACDKDAERVAFRFLCGLIVDLSEASLERISETVNDAIFVANDWEYNSKLDRIIEISGEHVPL